MEVKATVKRLYAALFVAAIYMPWLFWLLFGKYADSANYENRDPAPRPAFGIDTYGSWASDYESYFNDNLPFRNELISLNSRVDYYLFHASASSRVIAGKEGWLFYAAEDDGDPLACYRGENLYPQEQLQAIAENLEGIKEYLAGRGVEFVVFVAPNKERVYSEMMPDYFGKPAGEYAALQIVDYIKNNTDIRIVYPYEELMEVKERLEGCNLYYKTDTHWNYAGGYVGSAALLKELGIEMPGIVGSSITISETENFYSDLAGMLNMSADLRKNECDYSVLGYDGHNVSNEKWDYYTEVIYHSTDADPRKIYIVRDSFCNAMAEYIGSQFNDSYMVYRDSYTNASLLEQSPDIFVLEVVERYVGILGAFDVAL